MCTLILGLDVVGPGTVVVAANRDEDPARPSDGPRVLRGSPRVVGGRDRLAGGTWLAVREASAVVALLNRRPLAGSPARPPRSRGHLTLDVAAAGAASSPGTPPPWLARGGALPRAAAAAWLDAVAREAYAPFSLVFASPERCWLGRWVPGEPARLEPIVPGWHVITHAELDDPDEPRAAWLLADLTGFHPRTPQEAGTGLFARLALHGDGNTSPAVCIHDGRMVTVSTSVVWLGDAGCGYRHRDGRPCEGPLADHTALLADDAPHSEDA